jgi:hypothetical protein
MAQTIVDLVYFPGLWQIAEHGRRTTFVETAI